MLRFSLRRRFLAGPLSTIILCCIALCGSLTQAHASTTPQPASTASPAGIINNQKRVCVYDDNSVSGLSSFASLVGRQRVDCASVYDGSANWAGWVDPWFAGYQSNPDINFAQWVQNSPVTDRRQLIISQPLIPSGLAGTNWLAQGAAGDFTTYATQFAQNLIAAGEGDAVIRLSWEMNGTWNADSIGNTPTTDAEWVSFWRQTVFAMRAVPGAHFVFDWCPNNGYRNIPLANYYPGDDVVDVIGDDFYDTGVPAGTTNRFAYLSTLGGGLNTIIAFAKGHGKPLSIPEWGIEPVNTTDGAGGDDPGYIQGLASVIATNDVAFATYFYNYGFATELPAAPNSLGAFRAAFRDGGYAVGVNDGLGTASTTTLTGTSPIGNGNSGDTWSSGGDSGNTTIITGTSGTTTTTTTTTTSTTIATSGTSTVTAKSSQPSATSKTVAVAASAKPAQGSSAAKPTVKTAVATKTAAKKAPAKKKRATRKAALKKKAAARKPAIKRKAATRKRVRAHS